MSRKRSLAVLAATALLAGLSAATTAHAATATTTWYVDNTATTCSDTGPGTAAQPYCQIQPAADRAGAGDTVSIAATGTAYQPVTITSSGQADAPITFTGAPGTALPQLSAQNAAALTVSGAAWVQLSRLDLRASGATAVQIAGGQHIALDSGTVRSTGASTTTTAIALDGASSDIALTRLNIPLSPGIAVSTASGASRVQIADDTFNALGGGILSHGTTGLQIAGNTIHAGCGHTLSLADNSAGSVENTILSSGNATNCADLSAAPLTVDASSAPQVTADYNVLTPGPSGNDYLWAGTPYDTRQAFAAATGQGGHDFDQNDIALTSAATPVEYSPLIDSGDASAPGQLATDRVGRTRVNDPLVADAGTGNSATDRGAVEFQDPLRLAGLKGPTTIDAGDPATYTAQVDNPWSDPLDLTYTFDFGDGTTITATSGTATHTYTAASAGQHLTPTVTVRHRDGTAFGSIASQVQVDPEQPMTSSVSCGSDTAAPLTLTCTWQEYAYDLDTSAFPLTASQLDFGDGTVAHMSGSSGTLTHTYASPGARTVTEKSTDAAGHTASATATAVAGTSYVSVSGPVRILDTRTGTGAPKHRIGPGQALRLKVTGTAGVPAKGVAAVTVNLTDVNASSSSFVTAYPDGVARPTTSNLNFAAGQINPNLVTVPVGSDGYIDLYNAHGSVDLVADLQGYFTTTASTTDERLSRLAPLTPARVLDTRTGTGAAKTPLGSGKTLTVHLPHAGGVAVIGAVLNITATAATGSGNLTVYCGADWPPTASNINYRAGQTTSNLVVTNVCTGGTFEIYNHGAPVQVVADLQGLYTNEFAGTGVDTATPQGSTFVPTAPARVLDTRTGLGSTSARPIGANGTATVRIAGTHGVPRNATAVLVNLTGTAPTSATYLTAWGAGAAPATSNLNLVRGETRPVLAVVPLDANGCIHIRNHAGTVHIFADLQGYLY